MADSTLELHGRDGSQSVRVSASPDCDPLAGGGHGGTAGIRVAKLVMMVHNGPARVCPGASAPADVQDDPDDMERGQACG